ncbi:MAG: PA14 domain-containing protein, partial [Caldilineaceae bacterium]
MALILLPLKEGAGGRALVLLGAILAGGALAEIPPALWVSPFGGGLASAGRLAFAGELAQAVVSGAGLPLAAAGVVGAGMLLRAGRRGALILAGAALTLAVARGLGSDGLWSLDAVLLLLAPWLLLAAGYAADQLVRSLLAAWRPSLCTGLRPAAVVATALALLLGVQALALVRAFEAPSASLANPADREALAAAAFFAALRDEPADDQTIVLVPPALFDHPALRVAALGDDAARLTTWSAANIPFQGEAPDGLVYLLPPTAATTLDWLRAAYPTGISLPLDQGAATPASPLNGEVPDSFAPPAAGAAPLMAFRVPAEAVVAGRGLTQYVFAGSDWGSADDAQVTTGVGPLDLTWGANAPLPPPFSAEWSGSLLVPETGVYTFTAEVNSDALLSLQLDRRLLLDTSAGLATQSIRLPAGAYRMDLRYRSGAAPGNVTLLWQRTGHDATPIPLHALHNPTLPLRGLLATTTAGDTWDGTLLDQRKDPLLAPPAATLGEVSVVWQGQIGIPRAGEYLIGAVADDSVLINVAGQSVVERIGPPALDAPQPAEGAIYLERGWQPVSIRTVHGGDTPPSLALYWQAPGNGPQPLTANAFIPLVGP